MNVKKLFKRKDKKLNINGNDRNSPKVDDPNEETILEEIVKNETSRPEQPDYAMKLVLVNGLRRKQDLCDDIELKKLLKIHHFSYKPTDSKRFLLRKIKLNLSHFTVQDIHSIIYVSKE